MKLLYKSAIKPIRIADSTQCLNFISYITIYLSYYESFRSEFCVVMFGSSLYPVVCGEARVLYTLSLCAHSGVQHLLCCVFVFFVFVLLPVSLDFPFLIATSVSSSVYLFLYHAQTRQKLIFL